MHEGMKGSGLRVRAYRDEFSILEPERSRLAGAAVQGSAVGPSRLTAIPLADLDAFRTTEMRVARADASCSSQRDIDAIASIRAQYQRSFVAQNRGLLTELKSPLDYGRVIDQRTVVHAASSGRQPYIWKLAIG